MSFAVVESPVIVAILFDIVNDTPLVMLFICPISRIEYSLFFRTTKLNGK